MTTHINTTGKNYKPLSVLVQRMPRVFLPSLSESSEHITLWCSGSGPWYEVRVVQFYISALFIDVDVSVVPYHAYWCHLHFDIEQLSIARNRPRRFHRERHVLRVSVYFHPS